MGLERPAVDRAYAVIVDQIRAVTRLCRASGAGRFSPADARTRSCIAICATELPTHDTSRAAPAGRRAGPDAAVVRRRGRGPRRRPEPDLLEDRAGLPVPVHRAGLPDAAVRQRHAGLPRGGARHAGLHAHPGLHGLQHHRRAPRLQLRPPHAEGPAAPRTWPLRDSLGKVFALLSQQRLPHALGLDFGNAPLDSLLGWRVNRSLDGELSGRQRLRHGLAPVDGPSSPGPRVHDQSSPAARERDGGAVEQRAVRARPVRLRRAAVSGAGLHGRARLPAGPSTAAARPGRSPWAAARALHAADPRPLPHRLQPARQHVGARVGHARAQGPREPRIGVRLERSLLREWRRQRRGQPPGQLPGLAGPEAGSSRAARGRSRRGRRAGPTSCARSR